MSQDPESSSDTVRPGTTTETGDLERDESEEDGVESDKPDDEAAGDRDGVHSADAEVERDDEEDECCGYDCSRRRLARLGTVSRARFLGGPRTGDNLRTQLPTMSSHSHFPAFAAHM